MILEFDKQKIETIQKDRMAKVKFAALCGIYKATASCDWKVEVVDDVIKHQGLIFYELEILARRAKIYDCASEKREYESMRFKISGEDLRLDDVYKQSVIRARQCQK